MILEGFLLVDKPAGVTSYDCIRVIKRIIGARLNKTSNRAIRKLGIRIGHSGTLDTFATGLLIVAIGRAATKKLSQIIMMDKKYQATVSISLQTDTLDRTGKIIHQDFAVSVDQNKLDSAINALGNGYMQTPPVFSALKYDGKRLSDLARSQENAIDVEKIASTKERFVHLHRCEISNVTQNTFELFVHVSHGTYIRSLASDIAQKAGYLGACTLELRRTAIGKFSIDKSTHLDDISIGNICSLIFTI